MAASLPSTLPALNTAFRYGTQVLPKTVPLNQETGRLFNALDELANNPDTLLALKDLTTTVAVGAPLMTFVAPYQTVCNGTVYFFTGLGGHISEDVKGGTIERVLVRDDNTSTQQGKIGSSDNYRPADLPANVSSKSTKTASGDYAEAAHGQPYAPAIDSAGDADCQTGQNGYLTGPLTGGGRYRPRSESGFNADNPDDPFYKNNAGGSHVVVDPNTPGLAGTTYTGVPSLRDVP